MIYRTEHPKPQFMRKNWQNLNGQWDFEIDHGNSGADRGLFAVDAKLSGKINVPFCPESKLSGVEYTDFMTSVWYKRSFTVTPEQLEGCIRLHFGAVDYEAFVYINGKLCGKHRGGYVSFSFDITQFVQPGENVLTLHATDDTRDRRIPAGKQSDQYASYGCFYTRTTGIWQTVWLEFLPKTHIVKAKYFADIHNGVLSVHATLQGSGKLTARATYEGHLMGQGSIDSCGGEAVLSLPLAETHLWEPGAGRLYDLELTYGDDLVESYFGMRTVSIDGYKVRINGKSVFQRLILDQGFYPEGVYTAPSDRELQADIERTLAMGFNGARLHEKIFEERFLYHCDRLGYLVWGEFPNWGLDHTYADSIYSVLPEWLEELDRDFNHPAIICWCPFNETWDKNGRKQYDDVLAMTYRTTKAIDPTRPCIDTSGMHHVITDIYDLHNYEQDPEKFAEQLKPVGDTNELTFWTAFNKRQQYDGKVPFFVGEFGGTPWMNDPSGWGYSDTPESEEAFLAIFKGLVDAVLDHDKICGFCYTQLTDVEQEQNGLYTYDRQPKFDPAILHKIVSRKAAIEE